MNHTASILRRQLIERLKSQGVLHDSRVEAAMLEVPRHSFAHWLSLEAAYANQSHALPGAAHVSGASVESPASTISQPAAIALMLQDADFRSGQRVLEIGAGSGYNAALIAHLVGTGGHVVTVDIEGWVVSGARSNLAVAGIENVTVIMGDGGLGYAPRAPYDRIVATVGAWEIPLAWFDQLAPNGKIAAPVHLFGGAHDHDYLVLESERNYLVGQSTSELGMVLMRGDDGAHPEQLEIVLEHGEPQEPATIKSLRVRVYRNDDPDAPVAAVFKREGLKASGVLQKRHTRIALEAELEFVKPEKSHGL
jgi:protein-L-isoaspartate(D-aspartate) O-methyltransferase